MSKEVSKVNSSDIYKKRFAEYGKIYVKNIPDPPEPEEGGSNAAVGAEKAVQKRRVQYHNKDRQNHKTATGGMNNVKK